ncbi:hypothetical protein Droror1_Dr00008080 [Drosera rotundifolia]
MLSTSSYFLSSCLFILTPSLGLLCILNHILPLFQWIFATSLRTPKDLKKYGQWAIVTGSTDGIGKAFACQLARKGLNLVLVSRDPTKLDAVSDQIRREVLGTKVMTIVLEFGGKGMEAGIEELGKAIGGLDVGVLVNNVGISYPTAMYFDEVDEEVWMRVVRVNVEGTTKVTRGVLHGMIERRRGLIVNVGSGAGIIVPSHPLYAIYAATKAYVDQFSRSLYVEYKSFGIDVQCQLPLYVATKMVSKLASTEKATLFTPTAQDYAAAAVRRVGYEPRCSPYWAHSLQWYLASLLPEPALDAFRLYVGFQRRKKVAPDQKQRQQN